MLAMQVIAMFVHPAHEVSCSAQSLRLLWAAAWVHWHRLSTFRRGRGGSLGWPVHARLTSVAPRLGKRREGTILKGLAT